MRHRGRIAWGAALACCLLAQTRPERKQMMPSIRVATIPKRPVVLAGESLLVDSMIENTGSDPVAVHGPEQPSPFVYRLLDEKHQVRYRVSAAMADAAANPQFQNPQPGPSLQLGPQHNTLRTDDLAGFAPLAFAPGEYSLVAEYAVNGTRVESAPARIRVASPRVARIDSEASAWQGAFPTAIAHCRTDGGIEILARDGEPSAPQMGGFVRLHRLDKRAQLADLVTSVDVANTGRGRWTAWLDGDELGAASDWGTRVQVAPPLATGLTTPRFAHPGFMRADGGLFLVAGLVGGRVHLRQYMVGDAGWKQSWDDSFAGALPDFLRARYEPDGSVRVVWIDTSTANPRLMTKMYRPNGKPLDSMPRRVAEFSTPVLAWAIDAFSANRPAIAYLVCAAPPDGKPSRRRIPIDKPAVTVDEFAMPERRVPDEWAVGPGDASPVAVRAGAEILAWDPKLGWRVVQEREGAAHLQVLTADGRVSWLFWVDPVYGLMIRHIAGEQRIGF